MHTTYTRTQGKFGWVNAHYTRTASKVSVSMNTTGSFSQQLHARAFTVKLISAGPASAVSYTTGGKTTQVPFSRWGGAGTWSFDGQGVALVVELPSLPAAQAVTVDVTLSSAVKQASLTGLKGVLARAIASKRNLDETRTTPGAHTVDPQGAPLSNLAALGEALAYLSGNDVAEFAKRAQGAQTLLQTAVSEIQAMDTPRTTCYSELNTDADNTLRTSSYPHGLKVANEGDCCNACSGDAQCIAYVYESDGSGNCWPLSRATSAKEHTANRKLGQPKRFTRNYYSLELIQKL